jgi:L-lactate dehydrogenase (cytochrome)
MWISRTPLDACHNLHDLRSLARRRLPSAVFDFLDGAAESEHTASRNAAAFDDLKLLPRYLVDVSSIKTRVHVLGQDLEWPVFCSPTGGSRMFHPQGELAAARAAAKAGIFYGLSTNSTFSLEEVAAAGAGPKLFQLYIFKDRDMTRELIDRCKRAGYQALCLTVDVPVVGKRERDLRSGFGVPMRLSPGLLASFARRPGWSLARLRAGALSMPNLAARVGSTRMIAQLQYVAQQMDPSVSWKDVRALIEQWGGPFALKGVMSVEDAQRAVDIGATGIIVSNHGGRQLDGAAAAIEALPQIARAVGHQVDVILDGGVRRGTHILKALAMGAKACSLGRPYLYGLSAQGEAGVSKALDILRSEFIRAMRLSGSIDAAAIDRSLIQ